MKTSIVDPIDVAIHEDLGRGDITTDFLVPSSIHAVGRIVAKEKAIVAGSQTAAEVFRRIDSTLQIQVVALDGAAVDSNAVIVEIRGAARSILKGERVALNFLQRLSGVATLTRKFVDAAANPRVKILDTRKTTPGLRALEKAAVIAGGGANHRFGLFDMVLIKDNHLVTAPGFAAFSQMLQNLRCEKPELRIEVEAERLEQVRTFLEIDGVDVILLDNMKPAQMREAVALGRKKKVKFEASGGVTLNNVRQIAATGVDYISIGALTHSAHAIDFSLEVTPLAA